MGGICEFPFFLDGVDGEALMSNRYVACEEGIFEYEVNIEGRMQFPGASFM